MPRPAVHAQARPHYPLRYSKEDGMGAMAWWSAHAAAQTPVDSLCGDMLIPRISSLSHHTANNCGFCGGNRLRGADMHPQALQPQAVQPASRNRTIKQKIEREGAGRCCGKQPRIKNRNARV